MWKSHLISFVLLSVASVESHITDCVPLRCTRPLSVGDCNDWIIQYYFDTQTKRCKAFFYTGCGGNVNRFRTKKLCERTCFRVPPGCGPQSEPEPQPQPKPEPQPCNNTSNNGLSNLPARCTYKKDPGPCRAAFQRYYFDLSSGICRNFIYGGCKGNANNFLSKRECGNVCVDI